MSKEDVVFHYIKMLAPWVVLALAGIYVLIYTLRILVRPLASRALTTTGLMKDEQCPVGQQDRCIFIDDLVVKGGLDFEERGKVRLAIGMCHCGKKGNCAGWDKKTEEHARGLIAAIKAERSQQAEET